MINEIMFITENQATFIWWSRPTFSNITYEVLYFAAYAHAIIPFLERWLLNGILNNVFIINFVATIVLYQNIKLYSVPHTIYTCTLLTSFSYCLSDVIKIHINQLD